MTPAVTTLGPINFCCRCSSGSGERAPNGGPLAIPAPPHSHLELSTALRQKSLQPSLQLAQILEFALPDGQRIPAQFP